MKALLRFVIVIFLLTLTALFNIGLVKIRVNEIGYLLGRIAENKNASKSLGIVAKYELIKRRLESGDANQEDYEFEAKMQALISGDQYDKEKKLAKEQLYLKPVKYTVNLLRMVLGKPIINAKEDDKIIKVLEIGYFWERTRKYEEAIKVYDQIMETPGLSPDIRSAVLIHKAFCHSMMSDYKTSKNIYERVIQRYPNTDAGILSWKLLDFIENIEKKRAILKKQKLTDFARAKRYFMLMDYRNSIKYFSLFLQKKPRGNKLAEASFYKGRSHEELGETDEALMLYRKIIRKYPRSRWAKEASRRMLMLGEFYEQKQQIADEARQKLAQYKDQNFINKLNKFADLVSESSLKSELMGNLEDKTALNNTAENKSEMLDLINEIGNIDLTGEAEKKKRLKEEQYVKEQIDTKNFSEKQIKNLKRKILLKQHMFRKPLVLKKVIDDNSGQLRYLYNRRLRSGIRLSGTMRVAIRIASSGVVDSVGIISSNMGDKSFEKDILKRISTWKFKPVPDSLGSLTINYPFEFFEEY